MTTKDRFFFAELVRTIDGDTIELKIDTGFYNTHQDHFRLAGIDTPERGKGFDAHKKIDELLNPLAHTGKFGVLIGKADKYGRWLVTIPLYDGAKENETINQKLLDSGLAKPYSGGSKS